MNVLAESSIVDPTRIMNIDETGLQDIPRKDRFVGMKGNKAYRVVSSGKGDTTTVVTYVSAGGLVVPPMIIHKGKKVQTAWKEGKLCSSLVKASVNGYINKELFYQYGQHFINYLNSKQLLDNRSHLVLLDGHYSHMFNLEYMLMMKENNIKVLAFPPHVSHVLQPLGKVPFSSLKRWWNYNLGVYNQDHAGKKLSKAEWFEVFNPAWETVLTSKNVLAGFQVTGVFPVNPREIKE